MNDCEDIVLASGARVRVLPWCAPEAVFAPLADTPFALWFDSADTAHAQGNVSYMMADPEVTLTAKNGVLHRDGQPYKATDPFAAVAEALAQFGAMENDTALWADLSAACVAQGVPTPPPFRGGAAGLFGYDLGQALEALPPQASPYAIDDLTLPDMAVGIYDACVAFDHKSRRVFIFVAGRAGASSASLDRWTQRLNAPELPTCSEIAPAQAPQSNFTRMGFEAAIAKVIHHIHQGDIFQANLAQRFHVELAIGDTAFNFYRRLRQESPAPFACFAQFGDWALASASPERFLQLRDGRVETRPIKGTTPRARGRKTDDDAARALAASEKNRAENIMIVDLMRNDLARVCHDGSIRVRQLCALESFSNVHHLVSTVEGALAPKYDALDLLRGCFPGGSITGAPKIRAQEIIARGEPHCRGPYCGAMGLIGFDGYMDTNIIIRTAIMRGRDLYFHVGGGIVADSDPAAEFDETLFKARGLMAALGVTSK